MNVQREQARRLRYLGRETPDVGMNVHQDARKLAGYGRIVFERRRSRLEYHPERLRELEDEIEKTSSSALSSSSS